MSLDVQLTTLASIANCQALVFQTLNFIATDGSVRGRG